MQRLRNLALTGVLRVGTAILLVRRSFPASLMRARTILSASPFALTLHAMGFNFFASRQGSSVVEQGTHKPLVGSSNLPPGMFNHESPQ